VSSSEPRSQDALVALGSEIIDLAGERGTSVRALGGVGVHLRVPDIHPLLRRELADVDLVAPKKARREVSETLEERGLQPEREFNALQGARRQIWWTPDRGTHVDVFLGEFAMCHRLALNDRLDVPHPALPAADLLLTKLQVIELNHKDVVDAAALLCSHVVDGGDGEGVINRDRIVEVLSRDWGFYTTFTDNLDRLPALATGLDPDLGGQVRAVTEQIRDELQSAPKSRSFKLRSKIGRRTRWYDVPEETLERA
jgi:hypothetical protein